ncbi:SDR family NAD(P)-dependent oxidoreductase [Streptomyces sp. V4-01]|uniref:SDR family NAD(P)-dependent oxidoreductase n=1 Tax=Actinacidiphila polyblastidii TaxID=3110430 RepID=A0ABU7P9G6_9ACTN|nr:SDR family NAD(P)-dependent oxidoreductase [Streptomyces sp. V4-01]
MSNMAGHEPIAVIGMAGRFPGAVDLGRYWANLRDGVASIRFPSDDELLAAGVPAASLTAADYVKALATAPDVDAFDAEFFGLTPREARICDPQLRLFLECAHATLENAGYDVETLADVGVFGSTGAGHYLDLVRRSEGLGPLSRSGMSLTTWNSTDYLTSLVSYKLGLGGPSLNVATACSSSLVAVHLAAAALRAGECELALAGGVEVELPLGHGYWWEPGGTLSRDGHCRPFDKSASGTVYSSGVGMVALKRLSDALADGDHVRAVIRSTAVNNDGAAKAGFAAPSVTGQSAAVAEAMALADVAPRDVGMLEAHATGTVLGDPIEVAALKSAYQYLGGAETGGTALTSVKGNIGHTVHASGAASLIKVVLSLENETIPPSAGYQDANPALGIDGSPFQVPTGAVPWPRTDGRPRVAAVNSYGVGGTNAHAVVEEAPAAAPAAPPAHDRPRVVVWSARTPQAADRYRDSLAEHFAGPAGAAYAGSVATLQRGRTPYPHRGAVVAVGPQEAAALLQDPRSAAHFSTPAAGEPGRITFLFPGMGVQQVGVALDLYERSTAYAAAFDECLDLFEAQGVPLRELWRGGDDERINAPGASQPLIFAVEHSLARAWQAWGITPSAVLGHSLGEITAATVAGVFTLEDAVRAVTARSRALQDTPPGGMLAVAASRDDVAPFLTGGVRLAVVNGPRQVVVAGPAEELVETGAALRRAGLASRALRTTHASHAPVAAPAVPAFAQALRGMRLSAPVVDFYSAARGRPAGAEEVTDPEFWSRQLVEPVNFADALDALTAAEGRQVMIEAGPGRALTAVVRQHPSVADGRHTVLPTLAQRRTDPLAEVRSALAAVAAVWTEGHPVDWAAVEDLAEVARTPVPGYPYERERHWVDVAPAAGGADGADAAGDASSPFSLLGWQERHRRPAPASDGAALAVALLPQDEERARTVTAALAEAGLDVVALRPGAEYQAAGREFTVRPGEPWDLARVFRALKESGDAPALLVHAATLLVRAGTGPGAADGGGVSGPGADGGRGGLGGGLQDQLALGFSAASELVRQASRASAGGPRPDLLVLTERAVDVSGHDPLRPANAALTALVSTLPGEDVVARARLVDLGDSVAAHDLADELRNRGGDPLVALRGDRRWIPVERPLPLTPSQEPPLRDRGVYLVTGGTGGLGGVVARELARTGQRPVLILTGRKASPRPELLAELGDLGATAEVAACDVTDQAALAALVDDVSRRHGPVNGVFHLAGVAGSGMVAFTSTAKAAAAFDPKVLGTLALGRVFADRPPLDLFVAFSSRSVLEGVTGGADYAAANAVLDALVRSGVPAAGRLLTVAWPRWRDIGMGVPVEPGVGLDPDRGGALLMELLDARTPRQIAVRHFVDGRPTAVHPAARAQAAAPRPAPAAAVSAARGRGGPLTTADRLGALWTALLGRGEIGHDADFFDLGGNSLTAVELMTRVRGEFGVDLGIVVLFDHPTLEALADQIDRREA